MQLELVAGGCADDNVSSRLVGEVRPEWVSPGLLAELQFSTVPFSTCLLKMAQIVFGAGGLVPGN